MFFTNLFSFSFFKFPASKLVPASRKDDSNVISDHLLSSFRDETAAEGRHRAQATEASISEVISTQISASKSEISTDIKARSRSDYSDTKTSTKAKNNARSPVASGSESSIPEEVPSGSQGDEKHRVCRFLISFFKFEFRMQHIFYMSIAFHHFVKMQICKQKL